MRRPLALLLCCCACGGLGEALEDDAGAPDASSAPDASTERDAGEPPADAGGVVDAGRPAPDAGSFPDAGAIPDAGAALPTTLLYPTDRTQSPITPAVIARLQAIAARGPQQRDDVFAKVGDSHTVNPSFLACFAGAAGVDLGGRSELAPTLQAFRAGQAGSTTPFNRVSQAAVVGWSSGAVLAGSPSPLVNEVAAIAPRFAVVMYGTNDIQNRDVYGFGRNLFAIADTLISRGVVPVFSTVPPRDDDASAQLQVARYNATVRGVAQARGVPLVELHRELLPLPLHGLGPDRLHLNTFVSNGSARGCALTPAGLAFGNNTRNLLTLEALGRARAAVRGEPAPDATGPLLRGEGTAQAPFEIDRFPFTDSRDTRTFGSSRIATYPGCSSAANEGGNEVLYRFTLTKTTTLRLLAIALGGSDIDLHLLDATGTGAGCLQRNDRTLTPTLAPGTYLLSLDTFVSGGAPLAGEYLLVALEE